MNSSNLQTNGEVLEKNKSATKPGLELNRRPFLSMNFLYAINMH